MKVRLRDWAELQRISERTVQIHIKNNAAELEGHIDRRGKQGTWLDEFAQEFLLARIQLPAEDEEYVPSAREAALMNELKETSMKLAEAERRAGENAWTAGKLEMLESINQEQAIRIDALTRENAVLSSDNKILEQKASEAEKTAYKLTEANDELEALKERNAITENNLKTVQDRLSRIQSKWWYKLFVGKKS